MEELSKRNSSVVCDTDTGEITEIISQKQRDLELRMIRAEEKRIEKEYKNSPFQEFNQVNREFYVCLISASSDVHLKVFFLFEYYKDIYTNKIIISYEELQELLGVSRMTVYRAVKKLEELKFIKIEYTGKECIYHINGFASWSSYGNNYKKCEYIEEPPKAKIPKKRKKR